MFELASRSYTGSRLSSVTKDDFAAQINRLHAEGKAPLVDGYAPFCKHVFVPNFTEAKLPYLAITPENEHLLRSAYEARTEQELAVLIRWFPLSTAPPPPKAEWLDVILYSREQIEKEAIAMGRTDEGTEPWGIIAVKAQSVDYELPMEPITMMRNALGVEEGGSGVPLEREKYAASVEFHSKHAPLK